MLSFSRQMKPVQNAQYENFKQWLKMSSPYEVYVYYKGNSLTETIVGTVLAKKMMEHAINGEVYLMQKKIAPFVYEHWAIRAKDPPYPQMIPKIKEPLSASKIQYIGKLSTKKGNYEYGEETYS